MSDLDGLGPLDLDPEALRAGADTTLPEILTGAIIARVIDFEEVGPHGAQFAMVLSNGLRPVWWPIAVPDDVESPARFVFIVRPFDALRLLTPRMIAQMSQDRAPLGEPRANPVFRRIEGDRVLHVPVGPEIVLNEFGGQRQTLEMASGATVHLDAVGPSVGYPTVGAAANYGIRWTRGPARSIFFLGSGRRGR